MLLKDKVAIVTGSAQGIGRGIALDFAREGSQVVICDLEEGKAKEVAREVEAIGRKALALRTDVTNEDEVKALRDQTLKTFGRIDILVNNAGGSAREESNIVLNLDPKVWQKTIQRNLHGTMLVTRYILPSMVEKKYGKIINIASEAGRAGDPGLADYSAAKAGIIGFSRALAREVAEHGINVNVICPSVVRTQVLQRLSKEKLDHVLAAIPMKRIGEPEDIAYAASFLASDKASWITGQVLGVNGGRFIG
jgi:2-hydroxycyclohexanecarboxyl-CoA dehydrogenase